MIERNALRQAIAQVGYLMVGPCADDVKIVCEMVQSRAQVIYSGRIERPEQLSDLESNRGLASNLNSREPPPMPEDVNWPEDAKWLSPEEEQILGAAPCDAWKTAKDISAATGLPERDLASLLRNLVARNFLESQPGKGYRARVRPPQNGAIH